MRKFISYAFVAGLMFMFSAVSAQDYAFRVLANKGTNQVKKAGSGSPESLKTGAKLNSGDEIIASEGAYIGLMHKSGKTTEIRGAGTKKVADLEKTINTGSTSIASRYAAYVSSKMNEQENGSYRSRSNATGAVSRGSTYAIDLMMSKDIDLLGDVAILRWGISEDDTTFQDGDLFVVSIYNIFDEEIFSQETEKTSMKLDFADEDLQYDMGLYIVEITKKGDEEFKSKKVGIRKVNNEERVEVRENLANLKSEVSEDSPLNKIIYASFYEENGLLLDALTKYEEAVRQSPDVEDFQELYNAFLIKNGFAQ